ncbi:MAG: hypothetical protein WBV89_10605 [Ilumatobacter sp.]
MGDEQGGVTDGRRRGSGDEIVHELSADRDATRIATFDLTGSELADDVALVTYRSSRDGCEARRSSMRKITQSLEAESHGPRPRPQRTHRRGDVIRFQRWELVDDLFDGEPPSDHVDNRGNGDPQPAQTWNATHHVGIHGDPGDVSTVLDGDAFVGTTCTPDTAGTCCRSAAERRGLTLPRTSSTHRHGNVSGRGATIDEYEDAYVRGFSINNEGELP